DATFCLRDRADLSAQTDFTDEDRVLRQGAIVHARCERRRDCEITAGLLESHSTDDVEKHIELRERQTRALVEHRKQQGEPTPVEARRDALRCAEASFCRK